MSSHRDLQTWLQKVLNKLASIKEIQREGTPLCDVWQGDIPLRKLLFCSAIFKRPGKVNSHSCHSSVANQTWKLLIQPHLLATGLQRATVNHSRNCYPNLPDTFGSRSKLLGSVPLTRYPTPSLVNGFIRLAWRWAGKAFWGLSCFTSTTASPWNLWLKKVSNLGVKEGNKKQME